MIERIIAVCTRVRGWPGKGVADGEIDGLILSPPAEAAASLSLQQEARRDGAFHCGASPLNLSDEFRDHRGAGHHVRARQQPFRQTGIARQGDFCWGHIQHGDGKNVALGGGVVLGFYPVTFVLYPCSGVGSMSCPWVAWPVRVSDCATP